MDGNLLFDKYLHMIEYTFRLCGLHLRHRNFNMTRTRLLYCFALFCLMLGVGGSIFFIIKATTRGEGLVSAIHVAPDITMVLLYSVKSFSITWYHEQVDKLVFVMRELETKVDLNSNDNKTLIEGPINFLQNVLRVLYYFKWLFMIMVLFMQIFTSVYTYFVLNEVEIMLPFFIEYSFSANDFKIYPFALLHGYYCRK